MKVPEAIINSIDQHTRNVSKTFESMLKETQTAIAETAYESGYKDGSTELSDALLYISKWSNEKKANYFSGAIGLESILKMRTPKSIIEAARDAQKKSAVDAAKEKMNERITEDLKALCARREVPLTQVADVMQKMFDEGETE